MLNDLQRLEVAEAMIPMTAAERSEFLKGREIETSDLLTINLLIKDLSENEDGTDEVNPDSKEDCSIGQEVEPACETEVSQEASAVNQVAEVSS